jgi:hypothetical protein
MEIVTERLLHAERKQKDKPSPEFKEEKAMAFKRHVNKKGPQCQYCRRYGHIQKNCFDRIKEEKAKQGAPETGKGKKPKANKAVGLITRHVLGVQANTHNCSGATCHICNSKELFEEFRPLSRSESITLGDGRTLEATGTGAVEVKLKLPSGESKIGRLSDVLYVPSLAYNLLSVAKATEAGKTVKFTETRGDFFDDQGEVVAAVSKAGSLYYLSTVSH